MMNPLVLMAGALIVGWGVVWVMLGQQVRRQSELAKKIEELEARERK